MLPKPETTYSCKACGVPVTRKPDGEFVRSCECKDDVGIVAHLKATAYGESKVAQGAVSGV